MTLRNTVWVGFIALFVLLTVGWFLLQPPKIAFVRSQELIYNYIGMKEAQNKMDYQRQLWQNNMDSLEFAYQTSVQAYRDDFNNLISDEKRVREDALRLQEANLKKYADAIATKSSEMENKLTQGVLNQVNSFAEAYGQQQGYEVILGTTLSGSVLYGNPALDITDELLQQLNDQYHGND